jgi:hypothetical protein
MNDANLHLFIVDQTPGAKPIPYPIPPSIFHLPAF